VLELIYSVGLEYRILFFATILTHLFSHIGRKSKLPKLDLPTIIYIAFCARLVLNRYFTKKNAFAITIRIVINTNDDLIRCFVCLENADELSMGATVVVSIGFFVVVGPFGFFIQRKNRSLVTVTSRSTGAIFSPEL
jgi:hypothetical protein